MYSEMPGNFLSMQWRQSGGSQNVPYKQINTLKIQRDNTLIDCVGNGR